MRGWLRKLGAGSVLGLLLVIVACSEMADDTVTPEFVSAAMDIHGGPKKLQGFFNNPQGNERTCDPSGAPDEGTGQSYQSAEWIDRQGGHVAIYGTADDGRQIAHYLSVPKNAVRQKTLFCMRLYNGSHMQVKLKAVALERHKGQITEVNVGKEGFREPLDLYISYHQALVTRVDAQGQPYVSPITAEEAQHLSVAYEPDGSSTPTERAPSFNLSEWDKYILAKLPHFSKWVLILD